MYISRWTKLRQPRRRLSPHSSGVDEGAFAKFTPRRRFGARNQTGRMKGRRSLLSKVGGMATIFIAPTGAWYWAIQGGRHAGRSIEVDNLQPKPTCAFRLSVSSPKFPGPLSEVGNNQLDLWLGTSRENSRDPFRFTQQRFFADNCNAPSAGSTIPESNKPQLRLSS